MMIKQDEIAVCISGLATKDYEIAIKIAKKVFPFDIFYMHWNNRQRPSIDDCKYFDEPIFDYHCMTETTTQPECPIFKKITRKPTGPNTGGKIYRRKELFNHSRDGAKQILGHYYLVNSLPEKYRTIIRLRYDTLVSNKINYETYLEKAQQGYTIGFNARNTKNYGPPHVLKQHGPQDCDRCCWEVWDHMIFHPRDRLKNVEKLFKQKNLLGMEWGWYQVLCHQWGDNKFMNIEGGETLIKECFAPQEEWYSL